LIELRRSTSALRTGALSSIDLPPPLLAFDREIAGGHVRCLFNLGRDALGCAALGEGQKLFSCGPVDQQNRILGPLAACILEIGSSV
jgi:hypothetical protein